MDNKKNATIKNCLDADVEYEFFFSEFEVLNQEDYEHLEEMIKDGYIEGELVHGTGRGWWKLIS